MFSQFRMMRNNKTLFLAMISMVAAVATYLSSIHAQTNTSCSDIIITQAQGNDNSQVTVNPQSTIDIEWGENDKISKDIGSSVTHTYKTKGIKNIIVKKGTSVLCEKKVEITNIKGCIDQYASNFNSDANINAQNCLYNFSPLLDCELINFRSDKKNFLTNELVKLERENNNEIKGLRLILDGQKSLNDPQSPFGYRYKNSGKKEPKLIITTQDGLNTVCKTNFIVGKLGCTYEIADNYEPKAEINNGSCVIETEDPIIEVITEEPYKPGDRHIKIKIQYNGNYNRIETNAILSKENKIVRKFQPKLSQDGIISIPVNYEKGQLGYLESGKYSLALQINHYKKNLKEQIVYDINIRSIKKVKKPICGNFDLEMGEECDSIAFCKDCKVENLTEKQKVLIQKVVKNTIQKNNLYSIEQNKKEILIKTIQNKETKNEILLYAANNFLYTISGVQ